MVANPSFIGCCSKLIIKSGLIGTLNGNLQNDGVYEFHLNEQLKQQMGSSGRNLFVFSNDNGKRWDVSKVFSRHLHISYFSLVYE